MNDMSPEKPQKKQRSALAKWSRRGFIGAGVLAGGGLLIGVGVRPGNPIDKLAPKVAGGAGEQLINSWVKIDADNIVTAIVPHCEMGQGAHSVLGQMLADELDAAWDKVRVMQAPADGSYVVTDTARLFVAPFTLNAADWIEPTWNGLFTQIAGLADALITGGSSSIRTTGQHSMRIAGAAARLMLIGAAAEEWGVPAEEIETRDSTLSHKASGKSAPYSEFASKAAEQPMNQTPPLKPASDHRLMGKSLARTDIPSKINGSAVFGIDAAPEGDGLTYAAVIRPPVPGTTAQKMDVARAKAMPGVLQILNMGNFVAVVAESYWHAQQAVNAIKVSWSKSESPVKTMADQYKVFAKALDAAGETGGDQAAGKGDVPGALGSAAKTLKAEYKVPYLAHAPMEPLNCTAAVKDGKCEIWTSTQVPLMARTEVANQIGLAKDDITIHHPFLGGAFGRRLGAEYVAMAARLAQATGYPVKMIWSREEDIQKALYRNADTCRMRAGLDKGGKLVAFDSAFTQRHDPAEACVPAMYDIANTSIRVAEAELHLPFQAWRSVDHSVQGFFIESFIDEVAHAAGKDPVAFRLAMLGKSPRHKAVLEKVAKLSDWSAKGAKGPDKNTAKGVAIVESFGTIVAEVIEVDMSSGQPKLTKVWAVCDAGYVINPDGFRNQIEGGIVFGLTAALYGELELEGGAIKQSNFHDYKMLRIDETPPIEVAIINSGEVPVGGAGEPGLPPVAPALANAIFAATGKRLRQLPIAKQFA